MRVFLLLFLITFFLFYIPTFPSGSRLTIDREGEEYQLEGLDIGGHQYIILNDLKKIYGGEFFFNPAKNKLIWETKEHKLEFTLLSPYILIDEEAYNLVLPVEFKQGKVYLPFKTFLPLLLEKLEISEKSTVAGEYNILNLKASQKLNGILVEIYLTSPLNYEVFKGEGNWLILNFFEGKIDTLFFSSLKIPDIILESRAYQFESPSGGSAQLSLHLYKEFPREYHFIKEDPLRLQIILEDTLLQPSEEIEKNPIDVIIIDPGHGGENLGAVGTKGLKEKDVVLDIALRVEKLLKNSGKDLEVYLTRTGDYFVPLEQRSLFANQKGGDLFVSIHANSAKRKKASGIEVYFLAQAKNDEARAVAALENSAIFFEYPEGAPVDTSVLDFILMDMLQTEFLRESSDLAQMIHDRMRENLKIPSRGVDQAGFFVLNKTYMPSVLVETAFISNPEEERLLNNSSFRQKVAEALYQGILDFKNKYESEKR